MIAALLSILSAHSRTYSRLPVWFRARNRTWRFSVNRRSSGKDTASFQHSSKSQGRYALVFQRLNRSFVNTSSGLHYSPRIIALNRLDFVGHAHYYRTFPFPHSRVSWNFFHHISSPVSKSIPRPFSFHSSTKPIAVHFHYARSVRHSLDVWIHWLSPFSVPLVQFSVTPYTIPIRFSVLYFQKSSVCNLWWRSVLHNRMRVCK